MDEVYGNNRFYIEIDSSVTAVFTEVSGLSIEVSTEEYPEGGNNDYVHKIIGRTKIGNVTLKKGVTKSRDFLKWVIEVSQGKFIRKNISIVMYDLQGKFVQRWNFIEAAPVKWTGAQFQSSGNSAAIETFEFIHRGMQLGNKPPRDPKETEESPSFLIRKDA
jgi:phage tail-like protein